MFNYFPSIKSSDLVQGNVSPEEFLYQIKSGEDYANRVLEAREIYKSNKENYTLFKQTNLPCYSLNFTFNKIRSNDTINEASGYIYLDIDDNLEIELCNPLIFASWVSLSGNGRGVLVKVDGLNKANFSYTYNEISRELNINSDNGARKATQVNVLSYDPELYINNYSSTYEAILKKDQYSNIKREERTIGTVVGSSYVNLRFDNLDELIENIEFNGEVIYDFNKKIKYADAFIRFGGFQDGSRNTSICAYAIQVRALNPFIEFNILYNLLKKANQEHCHPPMLNSKIRGITKWAMNSKIIKPILNRDRRFVFNPEYKLSVVQKRSEAIKLINKERTAKSIKKIEGAIFDWDFETMGKITQKGIQSITEQSLNTIKKYYHLFKSEIQSLNLEYSRNNQ